MIIPGLIYKSQTLEDSLEIYSYKLIIEEVLIEAIKKDEINRYESATIIIKEESDIERADRLLSIAKNYRSNNDLLKTLRSDLEIITPLIINFLSDIPEKSTSYTLKRSEYKDRTYHFQLSYGGALNVHLVV